MRTGGAYILFVDDDTDDRELIRECCEELSLGGKARFVASGEELCHFLSKAAVSAALPSLIVLDVNMPGMDGRQVLERLKGNPHYNHLPVIMFSTSVRFAEDYLTLGADGFYPKPDSYPEFLRRIASFFERLTPSSPPLS